MTLLKSIVLFLVLANVGYFLWARGIGHPEAGAAEPAATLKLASEVPGSQRAPAVREDQASPSGAAGLSGVSGGTNVPAPAAALLTNVKRCISVGPFRDMAETAHAASTLRSAGYDPRQRVAEGEVWAGVWVYLPIPPSRTGDAMLSKLRSGGIEDALEMPGPGESSVISLGLYADQKRAQTRIGQAQALGFNPSIGDRKRTGDVYWIDIDLKPTDSVLKPGDLQSETGRIQRLEVKACPAGGAPPA